MTAPPIVIVAGRDPTLIGGGHASYVIAHALAAAAAGFAPQIFCTSARSEVVPTEFGTLRRVASLMPRGYRSERVQRRFLARGVARYVAELDDPGPHILHSFGAWAASGVEAARMLTPQGVATIPIASAFTTLAHENRAKVKALASHHGLAGRWRYRRDYIWVRAVADRAERQGYGESELVLVNYESVARLVLDACDPPPPLRIVPYAAPAAFREAGVGWALGVGEAAGVGGAAGVVGEPAPMRAPGGPPLIVSVARHDPRKGLDVLIHALARVARAGIPFHAVLAGPGPLLAPHRRLVTELGLSDRVEVPGYVDDVFSYLDPADVFVLPSVEEGSGSLALLEALQAGTAVVASRCDGIPEDLRDGDDALLVEPGSAVDLARALTRLLADAELRARLAARARILFERRFSAERFARTLGISYAELLGAARETATSLV
jgi:glycosyltransferase involved in cell wall biosynthesis